MKFKLYKIKSDYLEKSWIVLAVDVKDATAQIIFEVKDTLTIIDKLMPGLDVDMDLRVEELSKTVIEVTYGA